MSDYDMSIHTNPDAQAWVTFFRQTHPDCNVPDDVMLGWFANSMMAMHDWLKNKTDAEIERMTYRTWDEFSAEFAKAEFADRLRFLMAFRGMSSRKIAPLAGVSHAAICKYCKGEDWPKATVLVKLASALGVRPSVLLGEVKP